MTTRRQNPSPEMPVAEAARIVLSRVFKEVRRNLKLAAKFAKQDVEHVHRLRISTRRTVAALEVFREFLPANRLRVATQQLNQIRSAAASARDLDVLIQSQSKRSKRRRKLLKQLKQERKQAQTPIVDAYKQSNFNDAFRKNCRKLLKSLKRINAESQPSFAKWSKQKLAIYVSRFFSQRPIDMTDLPQLHRFRIEAKKFRYILGVVREALPPNAFKKVRPEFRRLQDELGRINDHVVAISRFRDMKQDGMKVDKRVVAHERAMLSGSIREFEEWWTLKKANSVQRRFESILCS